MLNNTELIYIQKELIEFANNRPWDKLIVSYQIFNSGTHPTKYILNFNGQDDNKYYDISSETGIKAMTELLSLRDKILEETGKRIWGLTLTLYQDGKYDIEYDYNVPEGFNEKGEWIGEEDFGEVTEFFDNIRNIGTDKFELK